MGPLGRAGPRHLRRGARRVTHASAHPESAAPGPQGGPQRVAIVHDWLTGMRGGEKVLEAICELYPEATLYHAGARPGISLGAHRAARDPDVRRAVAAQAGRRYRHYLPLFPTAVELFDLDAYDLVISSSHCAVKSVVRTGRGHARLLLPLAHALCVGPVRRLFRPGSGRDGQEPAARPVMARLARWDAATAGRVDRFVANSQYVAGRIRRYYNRGSTVVYPPVDTAFYRPNDSPSAPEPTAASSSCPPWFPTSGSTLPSRRAGGRRAACGL